VLGCSPSAFSIYSIFQLKIICDPLLKINVDLRCSIHSMSSSCVSISSVYHFIASDYVFYVVKLKFYLFSSNGPLMIVLKAAHLTISMYQSHFVSCASKRTKTFVLCHRFFLYIFHGFFYPQNTRKKLIRIFFLIAI